MAPDYKHTFTAHNQVSPDKMYAIYLLIDFASLLFLTTELLVILDSLSINAESSDETDCVLHCRP